MIGLGKNGADTRRGFRPHTSSKMVWEREPKNLANNHSLMFDPFDSGKGLPAITIIDCPSHLTFFFHLK